MLLSIRSEELRALTDAQLIAMAEEQLGIIIPPDTPRSRILVKIVDASYATRSG